MSEILEYIKNRTELQAYIDGAVADAMHQVDERWRRWLEQVDDLDLLDWSDGVEGVGPDPNDGAGDYIVMSKEIQRKVREALLAPATVRAGARAITSDPAFADNTWVDDARNTLTAALDAAGLGGDGHE